MTQLLVSLALTVLFLGCVPSHSDSQVSQKETVLLERPAQDSDIINRSLLYQNDSRVSYCEIIENDVQTYSGIRDTQVEPLASLSKVITSAWALDQLGADFQFKSEWYLSQVPGQSGLFDAYLKTNYDPIVNIEKILFYLSELNVSGVKSIRHLVIDETTRVYLSVLNQPHVELIEVPISTDETIDNLITMLNSKNWSVQTAKAKDSLTSWSQKQNRTLQIPSFFSVNDIRFQSSSQINLKNYPFKKTILSAPLTQYLKNMNVYSNNYLADAFFDYLGGVSQFKKFQEQKLKINLQDLQIYTGSGLADSTSGVRLDNLGSCFSYLKILSYLKQLTRDLQINLGRLLLNPTADTDGTYSDHFQYNNSVVLKTGRLFEIQTMNLAGFASTEKGILTFVFLGHDFTDTEADQIEKMRTDMLQDIFQNFSTQPDFFNSDEYQIFIK